jgi:beta-galactosidase/beta-glucuronidase
MGSSLSTLERSALVWTALWLCVSGTAKAQEWQCAASALKTRWANDVSPANVRPEYPRPYFVRKDWKCLNGLWEFEFDDNNKGRKEGWSTKKTFKKSILVPFTFEAALSGIGKGEEIHERVWYRRHFDVPSEWKGKRILLNFGAVDWESTVWVNGKEMGRHRGGYSPFTFDITDSLEPSGAQELVVAIYDPSDPKKGAFQPKGKQLGSKSIWYTRTTGIWQTVWLEPVPSAYFAWIRFNADLEAKKLHLGAAAGGTAAIGRTEVEVRLGDQVVGRTKFHPLALAGNLREGTCTLDIEAPRPWSPESPTIYDVIIRMHDERGEVDEVRTYTAFRSVVLEHERFCINGSPYFLRGVLDQGFWPDGIYTPPTDEAIKNDVLMTKAFGLNLARKHVKVEDPRWYYWCDKLGLLVAQDMPSSHNLETAEAKKNFESEWRDVINSVRNYPSVILWIPFNENWGDPKEFQDHIVDVTRQLDRSRPIIDASGWTQREMTDMTDIHDYGNDLKKHALAKPKRATWVGEYGGVALPVEGHTWVKGWGYQTVKTPDELVAKYKFLTDQINQAPGLSGFVYTQLTDVEQELNGLMTYDRIPKADPKRFAVINQRRSN